MDTLVVIKLDGNISTGLDINLKILTRNNRFPIEEKGTLPGFNELKKALKTWRDHYIILSHKKRILKPISAEVQGTLKDYRNDSFRLGNELNNLFNQWLKSAELASVNICLNRYLDKNENIQILLQIPNRDPDREVQHLPWHEWTLLDDYPLSEIGFSPITPQIAGQSVNPKHDLKQKKVRVLVILGNDQNIDVEKDETLFQNITNNKADVTVLKQPDRQKFSEVLWKHSWHILFFAGHSRTTKTGKKGIIELNDHDSLGLEQLKASLQKAIANGLQLAIFNSCDGLGLAADLSELNLPTTIVMRELIPDRVAQEFLKYFLEDFSQHQPLFQAVRNARQRLEGLGNEFPHADWLPIIWQNPTQAPFIWPRPKPNRWQQLWRSLPILLIISLLSSGLVVGGQSLGWLQSSELSAYDRLMQSRPIEQADSRILIVGADQSDLDKYGDPIPDAVFAKVLRILNEYQPRAIGLDAFRDQPVPPGHQELMQEISNNEKIITACFISINNFQDSIAPPNVSRQDNFSGFVDLYNDDDIDSIDPTIRRYLLTRKPNSIDQNTKCKSNFSFSFLLSKKYMEADSRVIEPDKKIENWVFDGLTVPRLQANSGGYHDFDAAGYQIMINYRNTKNPREVAQQVNLQEILESNLSFNPDWIRNRVIIVGTTAPIRHDEHHTPYGNISGPVIHGHVVSQLLSAVEEQRHLLSWWPQQIEYFWIIIWAVISSLLIQIRKHPIYRGVIILLLTLCIYFLAKTCFIYLGLWVPMIPVILVILLASLSVILNENIRRLS